jgi:hypothetical protein
MDASAPPTYSLDDIKVEHHPNSGIKAQIYPFNNFHRRPAASSAYTTPNNHPWRPFQSRLEFEVAELALEVGLNNEQTDRLINICHQCSLRKDSFTLKNHKDIHGKWEAASHRITKVIAFIFCCMDSEFDLSRSAVHERCDLGPLRRQDAGIRCILQRSLGSRY